MADSGFKACKAIVINWELLIDFYEEPRGMYFPLAEATDDGAK